LIGDKGHWRKGYATEATQLMVNHAFDTLNLNRVQLDVFSFNKRAIQVYERVGFVCEGTLRQTQYNNGAYHDDIVMSVLRDEWKTNEADRSDR
jgi:RimJ/RimL family protein N-acetyltransferase